MNRIGVTRCLLAAVLFGASAPAASKLAGNVPTLVLAGLWAYARPYTSDEERTAALDDWLHIYNHHRHHTAIDGTPTTRLTTWLTNTSRAAWSV